MPWPRMARGRRLAASALVLLSTIGSEPAARSGTTRFVFDGNRVYAELGFVRPDGSIHRALAFVDMGSPDLELRESLFRELGLDRTKPLVFTVGDLPIQVPAAEVTSEPRPPSPMGGDLQVEATLPATVLQRYEVVFDYQARTMTIARPGTLKPGGVAMPFRIGTTTGLIAVDAVIDGRPYPVTIDNGSAYTWFSGATAAAWRSSHPDWERGTGAVGAANMMMSGDATETSGILLRIPELSIGGLTLKNVGALATGPSRNFPDHLELFDWYSRKNAVPVVGWIGGNVLAAFRLTIDYPARRIYWEPQTGIDRHDLDQVGLTLKTERGAFVVAAIAAKDGRPTVKGVLPGDRLIRVDGLETRTATWGAIFASLRGRPGDSRSLLLERNGILLTVSAPVTGF